MVCLVGTPVTGARCQRRDGDYESCSRAAEAIVYGDTRDLQSLLGSPSLSRLPKILVEAFLGVTHTAWLKLPLAL